MADIEEMRKRGYTGPDLSGLVSNNDAASSLGLAQGANPDQEAQIRGAAKTAGLPIPIANANPDIVRRLAQKVEAMNALKQAPKTADYLSNVQNAKIAHDDVPALAGVEAAEKEHIYSNGVWSAGFKLAKRFAKGLHRTGIGLESAIHSQIGGFFENMAETVTNPYLKEPLQNAAEFFFRQEIEGQKRMNDITRKYFEDPKMDLPEELRGRLIDNPEMALDPKWLAVNMTDFASSFVPVIAATMIGGPVAGGVVGGALEGSDLYNQLREQGTSTEDAGAAMIAFGVVTGVLNKIGANRLLAKMPVGNMAFRMMHRIVTGATEAGTEYMEEPFQAAFASIAQGKNLESTAEAVLQSLSNIEVIPGAFLMGAALNSTISESKRRTESSTAYANRITSISNALAESKLKERSPEDTESFLRTLGVREDLYISPEGVQALFQADPQILEKLGLDPAKALEDAQTGQDSRVPAAAVLARLLPEEVALFQQDIKPSPGAFTMRDMKAKVDAEEVSRLTAAAGTAIREEIDFGVEVDRIIGEARTAIDGLENFKGVNTEEYLAQYRTILERFANRWAVGTGKDRIQFLQKIKGVMQKYFIESGQSIPTEYLSLSQRMAETPEFKQWFRESKVVDAEGKPLVVYHGTRRGEFTEFDPSKKGSNTFHKGDEVGFHFTTDKQDALVYAGQYAKPRNAWPEGSRVISAYVSIQNPLVLNSGTITKEDISKAVSDGHDGIIANAGAYGHKEIVVFSPTQIKSVNNRGAWDMRNPNIFWQTIKQTPEFAEFFRDTKVVDEQGNPLMVHHSGTFRTEEDEAFDTTAGVHFGTLDAARARIRGKAVDDALQSIETYQNDSGLWEFSIDNIDYGGEYESEAEAREAAEDLAATTDMDLPWEDAEEGITSVYLNLKNPKYVGDQGKDWSAAIALAKEQGYDGLIYRNLYEDAGSISYVAFYPEQIKHVNNLRPTADPRIMFQNEETRLSVLHNLSAENLLFADKMGGLALPSLGVVTSDVAYTGFGDITLIGNPELGDPTQVPIFDADAFTARFPQPEYSKAKVAVAQRLVDKIRPWAEKHDRHAIDGTWEYLTQHPSMGNLRSLWQRSSATRAMFLEEEYGTKVDPVMRPKGARNAYSLEPAMIKFVKGLGQWWNLDASERETMLVDAGEAFKKSVHSHYRKVYKALFPNLMDDAEIDRLVVHDPAVAKALSKHLDDKGALFFSSFDTISNDIADAGKMVVDEFATRDKLERLLKGKEGAFEKWLDKMLSGKLEMHLKLKGKKVPYTLDNIVKAMTKRGVKGKEDMGSMFTEGLLRAVTAFKFPSVSRMRKGAAEQIRSEKEVSEARVKTQAALTDYRNALRRYYAYPDYMAMANDAMKAFSLLGKRRDRSALRAALSRLDFKNVPDDILDQGLEAFEMFMHTPVPFFEGKPQRAVKLNEFVGAVVPEDASPEVLDVLKKNGLVIKTYPPRTAIGDEKAQAQATRELREELEAEGQRVFFQDSTDLEPVRNEIVTALAKRPWTLKLFNDPQMKGKEGKVIKVQTIQQTMKQQKYSKIEKELVEVALQSQLLAGKDAIPFDQFRYVLESLLFPLEQKVSTGHYGTYGLDNIGAEKKNAVVILYNGPVEHGVTGHFAGDYKTTRERRKFVAMATGEPGVYVAMDEARPAGITDPAMLVNYVGDVGTKEEVEAWIREYNTRAASPKKSGLFCHVRRNDAGGVRHITELQSDFYQRNHPVVTLVDMIQKDPKSAAQVQAVRQLEKLNDAVSAFSPDTINAIVSAQRSARRYRKTLKENEARLEEVEKEIEEAREKQDAMLIDALNNEKERLLESIVAKQRWIESAEKGRVNAFEYNHATGEVGYIDEYEILPKKSKTWAERSSFVGVPAESSLRLGLKIPTHVILKVREQDGQNEILGQPIYFTETDKQSAREYAYEIKEKDEFEGHTNIKYDIVPVSGDAPQIQEFQKEYQDTIRSYTSAVRARDKFVMEGFTGFFTPLQKQLVAQREKYPLRILREEIRAAAQAGSPVIRIAKPYTLAAIEGYISPALQWAPAPGVDMDNLRPGDVIEIDGIDKIVVEKPTGGVAKVIAESKVLSVSVEEILDYEIDTDINWSLEELPDKLKFVVLRTDVVNDEDSGQLRLPGTEVFFKEVKYDGASVVASETFPGYSFALAEDELSEDSYGVASRDDLIDAIRDQLEGALTDDLQESLEKGESSHGDTFTLKVRGRYADADIDLEDFIRDLVEKEVDRRWEDDWEQMTEDYLGDHATYFWKGGGAVQYVWEDDGVEELPISIISEDAPEKPKGPVEREPDYMGEGLSPAYAGIVQKYAELGKLLAKELPEGFGTHVDKNGFGWYESKVPPERATEPVTLFQVTGRRAAVTIRKDGYLINMFQGADPSSLVHETAHVFLEEMKEAVMNGTATKEFEQDYLAVLKWTGNTSGELTVADHEKFAKGFEAYLQEGKAPSMEMEPVFASFRRWLTAVYKEAKKQLGVKLNNEVRRIFDRMITAETSTRQTSLDMFSALKTDEELTALNVSGEDRDYLRRLLAKAQQTAEENLIKAKAKSLRQNMKRMREDAKAEVDEDQIIADQLSKAGGLNRQELLDAYGPSILDTLPSRVPPLVTNNGVPLEAAAAAGGFVNVSAMIRKLEGMKPKAEAVDAALNRMIEEHDQKFQDPTPYLLETKEFQDYLDIIAKYYRQDRKPSRQIYADRAKAILGLKRVPDAIRHDLPLQAMRRAQSAERKALLAGNLGEAQKANAQQLLNLAMVKQAMKNRKVWEQIQRRARAYSKSGGINVEYREVIRDIVGRFGIIEGMAAQAPDKLKPLANMIQGDGTTDPFPASDFLLHPQLRSYRDLSFDELQEVGDLLNYLASQGRDINKTLLEDGKTTVEQAAIESAEETADLKSIKVRQKFSLLRKLNNFTRGTFARLNSLNFIAIAKGGYQNIGSKGVKSKTEGYIFDPLVKAQAAYDLAMTADLTALQPHMDQLYKTLQEWKKQFGMRMRIQGANTPSLLKLDGQEGWWTGEQILSLALNQGNAGNQERILAGYPDLTQDTVNKLLDLLSKEDWDAIQGIWDLIDSKFQAIDAVHTKLQNFHMRRTPPDPVRTKFGILRGGYYPAVYDPFLSVKVAEFTEADDLLARSEAIRQVPAAKSGMTKARVSGVRLPIKLSLGVVTSHLSDVNRYITHAEPVRNIDRIIRNRTFADETIRVLGKEVYDMIRPALKYAARPVVETTDAGLDRVISWLRGKSTAFALAWNIGVAIQQPAATFSGIYEIGGKYYAKGLAASLVHPASLYQTIVELSPYMASRAKNRTQEMREMFDRMTPDQRRIHFGNKSVSWAEVQNFGFWPIQLADMATVIPVWQGAFTKGLDENNGDVDAAVAYADGIVRKTQGSAQPIDLTHWQRMGGAARLFSLFSTFTIGTYGQRQRLHFRAWKAGKISSLEYAWFNLCDAVLPALTLSLSYAVLYGVDFDDDEWGEIAKDVAKYILLTGIPIVGQLFSPYGRVLESPVGSGLEETKTLLAKGSKLIEEDFDQDAVNAVVWQMLAVVSFFSGVPVSRLVEKYRKGLDQAQEIIPGVKYIIPAPKNRRN